MCSADSSWSSWAPHFVSPELLLEMWRATLFLWFSFVNFWWLGHTIFFSYTKLHTSDDHTVLHEPLPWAASEAQRRLSTDFTRGNPLPWAESPAHSTICFVTPEISAGDTDIMIGELECALISKMYLLSVKWWTKETDVQWGDWGPEMQWHFLKDIGSVPVILWLWRWIGFPEGACLLCFCDWGAE